MNLIFYLIGIALWGYGIRRNVQQAGPITSETARKSWRREKATTTRKRNKPWNKKKFLWTLRNKKQ